ncbi:MAG: pyrroline-5-carboxylate reductase [Chloroflexi bacterium]|nr:pyrroline-5-carboxylate reductase [Chloroflexota bacterium]
MKLAFIGGGVMGEAIIAGALGKGVAKPGDVVVCDILSARREHLAKTYGVRATEGAAEAIAGADIAVLAVKPQEFAAAALALAGRFSATQTVMSIMAGMTVATVRDSLRHEAVVRAIPNTPAQIGEGMTVWTATEAVPEAAREDVRSVLSVLGLEIYVGDEKYIDMATAVSSSGPAYVFLVMEAFIDAAVHIGLRRDMAETMVIQTILGSARYAQATGKHPAALRNQVTSPGGTTTEGLLALERAGLRAAFTEAILAAYEKAKRLGG